VYEYLALFLIVLLHEFGHALACRSVGGRADQIILWPLGGVAYVDPPQRPGATLWSIAAGPLVNALLVPIFFVMWLLVRASQWGATRPDLCQFATTMQVINLGLLLFNLLPIYPLDGGQILRSLLWFLVGRARSLMIASTIGLVVVPLIVLLAIKPLLNNPWLGVLAAFALLQCWTGFQHARLLTRINAAPRRAECACPSCGASPPTGEFWICGKCRQHLDMFATNGFCPNCGVILDGVRCMECGQGHTLRAFIRS
jgi:Zn-dependent protease